MMKGVAYRPALADTILERLAAGEALSVICRDAGMPTEGAVRAWARDDRDGFGGRFRAARERSAEHWDRQAEQVLLDAPSDRDEIARARELASHYRWRASKMAPGEYGERQQVEHTGQAMTISIVTGVSRNPGERLDPPTIDGDAE